MKNSKKMLLGIVIVMALSLCMIPMSAVHADDGYEIKYVTNNFNVMVEKDPDMMPPVYPKAFRNKTVTDLNVKIGNKKVISAMYSENDPYIALITRKTGKSKLTITANVNGKKRTCKGTVKVVKLQKGFSELKLGGKNYLNKIHNGSTTMLSAPKNQAELEYKLSPGWQIKSVDFQNSEGGIEDYTQKFRSGTTLPTGMYSINLVNVKGKFLPHFMVLYILE